MLLFIATYVFGTCFVVSLLLLWLLDGPVGQWDARRRRDRIERRRPAKQALRDRMMQTPGNGTLERDAA